MTTMDAATEREFFALADVALRDGKVRQRPIRGRDGSVVVVVAVPDVAELEWVAQGLGPMPNGAPTLERGDGRAVKFYRLAAGRYHALGATRCDAA